MRNIAFLSLVVMAGVCCGACSASGTPERSDGAAGKPSCDGACCEGGCSDSGGSSLSDIRHLVIIYLENRSFDHLYGSYPGAEGLSSTSARIAQIDKATGMPYALLPQSDIHFPDLVNRPFDITQFLPAHQATEDPVHLFFREQLQIGGGRMDRFVTESNTLGLTVGFYPTAKLPLVQLMTSMPGQVTVCDRFFHAAFGGSFLNHFWLIAAATPLFPNAPPSIVVELDAEGNVVVERAVTPDGYVVNATYPRNAPRPAGVPEEELLPNQTFPTIGDRLNDAGVDWAWYAGGWDDALAGNAHPHFAYHHQAFVYFANYADGSPNRRHLKDENDFFAAARAGTLPPVSFVKPLGTRNEHPGAFDLETGENHVVELVRSVMNSPVWRNAAVIVTYDENGGFWDHVPPPVVDRWGPGTRIPAVVFSRFAKGGVDSTPYDTTALLKLIERRWDLPALGARDAAQEDMSVHAFNFVPNAGDADADADADGSGERTESGAREAGDDGEPPVGQARVPPPNPSTHCDVPPVPAGMQPRAPTNPFAYIPPQCYTKTRTSGGGAANPCYPCHQASTPPNFVDDAHLQLSLQLPIAAAANPWRNLFDPPHLRAERLTDGEILDYVRQSNYFDDRGAIAIATRLEPLASSWDGEGDRHWQGYVPDAWFQFDDEGFDVARDRRETGWRAFAYYPFPGTFFPTNGSMDDVLIRLDRALREDVHGQADRGIYEVNLAIVEALISRRDVPIDPVDESALGVDLDLDGHFGRATRVAFDSSAESGTRMRYVGRAGVHDAARPFPIEPGLFPLGTEFLHSVRYLDVTGDGAVTMAPRMKELRYAKKVKWLAPSALRARAASEMVELASSSTGARKVLWEYDRGVYNGQGWLLQGFIEAADGSLRPQSYEETVHCAGCHGGLGATTDSMFAFARKLGFASPNHGWFHWTQHGLQGLPEPRRSDGRGEYELYLRNNGAGDDLRENDEIRHKFFGEHGRVRADVLTRMRGNIAELLVPSAARALDLDRAYRAIVDRQSFHLGRAPVLAPARHVFAHAPIGKKTGVLAPVAGSLAWGTQ